MKVFRELVNALVDLIWPPREGDPEVSFARKVAVLAGVILVILTIALASC